MSMGTETERKFVVTDDGWRQSASQPRIVRQGYFDVRDDTTVRVRTFQGPADAGGDRWAELTIKGPPDGWDRLEFEYDIPPEDASEMLDAFCDTRIVHKRRHRVEVDGVCWTVDAFEADNAGLVVAEVELGPDQPLDDLQNLDRPDWVGRDVSGDRRFTNGYLARHPFQSWVSDESPSD
jgi:adenylate cyclase